MRKPRSRAFITTRLKTSVTTAGLSPALPVPVTTTKAGPDWKSTRERQQLLTWASELDRSLTPLTPGNLQWTFFLTLTFRYPIPTHLAMNAGQKLHRWSSAWRVALGARTPFFRLLLWSAEGHATGNVHLHALSVTTPAVSPRHCRRCRGIVSSHRELWRKLKESWFLHYGIARIRPYDPSLNFGAARYITKYVLDESCLDWGIFTW